MIGWANNINFLDIRNPIKKYANQSEIDPNRRKRLLVALFHCDLDIPTLIRVSGENHRGEYRDVKSTIRFLHDSECDPNIISDLEKNLTIGHPNKLIASSTRKKTWIFFIWQSYFYRKNC